MMAAAAQLLEHTLLSFTAPTPGVTTRHAESGIVSTCLFGTFNGEWATASINELPFDTLLLTRGSNRQWHGKLGGEPFSLEPHSRLLISYIPAGVSGELHYYAEANPSSLLMFPPGRLASMLPAGVDARRAPLAMVDSQRLIELFQLIETEILAPVDQQRGQIDSLTRMLAHYMADLSDPRRPKAKPRIDISPHKLKRVLDYIDDHLGDAVDLDAMADVAGLSRYHFLRVFKCATGCSPHQHLIHRRIARAQTLIAHGELSLSAISRMSGFSNPGHFSTFFKRRTGMSPTRYRELVQHGVDTPFDPSSF